MVCDLGVAWKNILKNLFIDLAKIASPGEKLTSGKILKNTILKTIYNNHIMARLWPWWSLRKN